MKRLEGRLIALLMGVGAGLAGMIVFFRGGGDGPLMRVDLLADPGWAAEWASRLVPASVAQERAFHEMLDVLTSALVLTVGAAVMCGLLLLAVERISTGRSVAIRTALGIGGRRLALELLRGAARPVVASGVVSLAVVAVGVLAVRWTWPHGVIDWRAAAWIAVAGVGLTGSLTLLLAAVLPGLAVWRRRRLYDFFGHQSPDLAPRGESMWRDLAVVAQVGVAVTVLLVVGGLVESGPEVATTAGEDTLAIPMEVEASATAESRVLFFESILDGLSERAEVRAESLATPGALIGLGAVGPVMAQCGRCFIGTLYAPVSVLRAEHHAVGPGFFRLAGARMRSGREFTRADMADAPKVAVVNRSFAERRFENGEPLGRKIQIGGIGGEWFEVVGVVEMPRGAAIGSRSARAEALYLPVLQAPPARVHLIVEPAPSLSEAPERLTALLPAPRVSGPPTTLARLRSRSWAPLAWLRAVLLGVMVVALTVAATGVGSVMRVAVERRRGEIGLRMALGARPWRIHGLMLARALRRLAWGGAGGFLVGLFLVGRLQSVTPEVTLPPWEWIGGWTALLAMLTIAVTWGPARAAAGQEPARVLAGS